MNLIPPEMASGSVGPRNKNDSQGTTVFSWRLVADQTEVATGLDLNGPPIRFPAGETPG
jgi:hypothetical protein